MENLKKYIEEFLTYNNKDLTNENANKDAKIISTHRDLLAGILSKEYAGTILPSDIKKWHDNGYGHIHDLDYFISPMTNCCLVNYEDMLQNGFNMGNATIESPKSIGVATTILTQIILSVASSQYGGQSLANIDFGLEPYVEKSYNKLKEKQLEYNLSDDYINDSLEKEVHDAMQTFLYQVNTTTSCSGQTPFITISLGLNTSKFGKLITKSYLEIHKNGLGSLHNTPVFPKVVFFLNEGVNLSPNDPNYDLKLLAIETCAERIYPDFVSVPLNMKNSGSTTIPVTPMGCRSFLSKWNTVDGEEKFNGRFNLGVVSVNLPLIAYESSNENDFFKKLKMHMNTAYEAHMIRIDKIKSTKAKQNPILFTQGALSRLEPEDEIGKLFYNGYASISIGYVGLSECSEILNHKMNKDFEISVLKFMKDMCLEFKELSSLDFSLYGTPAESLCYKFAKSIKEKGYNLKNDYLTNSFHVPVSCEISMFDKWIYEEGFALYSNGGNIGYVETPNLKNNLKALEAIIDFGYKHIPYFGINQPVDYCFKCNYSGEFGVDSNGFFCKECSNRDENTISVIRRVSGYLSSPSSRPYNNGKQQEVIQRIKHKEDIK